MQKGCPAGGSTNSTHHVASLQGNLRFFFSDSTKQPNMFVQGVILEVRGHANEYQSTESRFNLPPLPTLIRPTRRNVSCSSQVELEVGHMSRRLLDRLPANIHTFICIPAEFSRSGGCDPPPGGLVCLGSPPPP